MKMPRQAAPHDSLACEILDRRDMLSLPDGFSLETIVAGLVEPTAVAYAEDGRMFVAEKAGRIRVVQNGQIISTFIDLSDQINSKQDRGLIGMALDPDFSTNGRVYLNYTVELRPNNPDEATTASGRIQRVDASATNPNVADLSTRKTLLSQHENPSTTHSVGDIEFDAAGNLIFSWGDGGFNNSLRFAAQDIRSRQGKIFRVDPETGLGIPGNPFYESGAPNSIASKVLAVGVRNPWRMSRDAVSGNIYFGDVTDGGPEEINLIRPSDLGRPMNFGWPYYEGTIQTNYGTPPAGFTYTPPYISYNHIGQYDAITNGVVFRGDQYPAEYRDKYFFANFGQNVVYTANELGNYTTFASGVWAFPVDIQLAPSGRLHFVSVAEGTVRELVHATAPNGQPVPRATLVVNGLIVQGDASQSTDPQNQTLEYRWDFDQDGLPDRFGVTPTYKYDQAGSYSVALTVVDPDGNSDSITLQVQVEDNTPPTNDHPVAAIAAGARDVVGPIAIQFIGSNSFDPNGDPLSYLWDFGDGGASTLANPANTFVAGGRYTVSLTVTDPAGLSSTATTIVNVLPGINRGNLALGKPAFQSSTSYNGSPGRANDGNPWGYYRGNSVSHTARQRQPFWQVDLQGQFQIDDLTMFNRTDVGGGKLRDVWILVSANPFSSGNLEAAKADPGVFSLFVHGEWGAQQSVQINAVGRHVRVQLDGTDSALALAEVIVTGAPSGTFYYNGHQYRLTSAPMIWNDAQAEAVAAGGNLVAIDNQAENDWLVQTFGSGLFFTSLTDKYIEGAWGWDTDQILDYTNWLAGEPDDAGGWEDFAVLRGSDGKWLDRMGWESFYGIIEVGPPLHGQFFYYNNHVYEISATPQTWSQARDFALARGGDLLQIDDADESVWIQRQFWSNYFWIGANDLDSERSFRWANGDSVTFSKFFPGEPGLFDRSQNAVVIGGSEGIWWDWNENAAFFAIIEYAL